MQLRFYVENGRWYADVPGHTQEENEMVSGSDMFLSKISKGKPEVVITFENNPRRADVVLLIGSHDEFGADYLSFSNTHPELQNCKLWICNVTHDVMGEHPNIIMFSINE